MELKRNVVDIHKLKIDQHHCLLDSIPYGADDQVVRKLFLQLHDMLDDGIRINLNGRIIIDE